MSFIEKTQMAIVVANGLGADLEDRLEGERKASYELSGAAQALKQAAKKVPTDLVALLDRSMEQGEIKDMEAAEAVQLVKKYLTRVGDFLDHLGDVEQQKAIIQGGRAAGLEDAMKLIQRRRDEEAQKLQRMLAAAEQIVDGEVAPGPRSEGEAARAEHGTVAERRAAEHGSNYMTPSPPQPVAPAIAPVEAPEKLKKKTKKRE